MQQFRDTFVTFNCTWKDLHVLPLSLLLSFGMLTNNLLMSTMQ
jgi:hypothetical protein